MDALDPTIPSALAEAGAHPHDPDAGAGVEVVQTHLSWVFLTRQRVYKLRKAARLGFVDFGRRAERNRDCLREVALNRRLAPRVYLGVAPVRPAPAGAAVPWRVGPIAEALAADERPAPEHCVVMRRLPDGRDALSLLETDALTSEHLDAVARCLAHFHARHGLGAPAPFTRQVWLERLAAPVRENFRHLARCGLREVEPERTRRAAARAEAQLAERADRFDERRLRGSVVDGHGDVHLQHVWFEDGPEDPVLIDCIEFDAELRRIDTASEVAFLAMDLAYRGRRDLGERFLGSYAAETDDFGLYDVVDWFASYRAAVRAKVAALAAADPGIDPPQRAAAAHSAARHLELAEGYLEPPRGGALVLMCGAVGTGKSSVARVLADRLGGVVVSSDRTRKRLAGLAPTARVAAGPASGLYTPERTEGVYRALLERAEPALRSGRAAVLDATYARRAQRERAARWAAERGVPCHLVEVTCAEAVAQERLARREREGGDASDAGPSLQAWSLAHFEPPDEWPEPYRHAVATDREPWSATAAGRAVTLDSLASILQK